MIRYSVCALDDLIHLLAFPIFPFSPHPPFHFRLPFFLTCWLLLSKRQPDWIYMPSVRLTFFRMLMMFGMMFFGTKSLDSILGAFERLLTCVIRFDYCCDSVKFLFEAAELSVVPL